MCGIFGAVGHAVSEQAVQSAIASMRHRGPDGSGVFKDCADPVALGHARLSIIDLVTGAQPLYSEDGDLVLVCNGEIYEFERQREELKALGHLFRTGSDAEVIIHLYQQHGISFVDHLRGEYAFLLYDRNRRMLLAVRDRFGVKPLFFNDQGGRLLFASEAKAMMASGLLEPRLSVEAVRDFFSMVIPNSMFEGVEVVPPGCMVIADVASSTHEIRRYWDCDLPLENDKGDETDFDHCTSTLREEFDEAVRLRLRADVPVGVYLSGGIDSAIVAATAAKYHHEKVIAFNIAFPEDEAFNEFELSREMAAHIGAEFHSVECGPDVLLAHTEDCIWVTELPFPNFHGVGKFVLSKLAQRHVKVILTGEGSDEVFLGYVFFQPGKGALGDQIENRLEELKPPRRRKVREIVDTLGFVPMPEHAGLLSARVQKQLLRLFHRRHRPRLRIHSPLANLKRRIDRGETDGRPPARQMQYAWIKNMLAPYLLTILGDRPEMGHSIEGRTPFLDHHLFEFARHIPDRFKIHAGTEKHVLREAFKDRLTVAMYRRRKWPYSAPPLWITKGRYAGLDALLGKYLSREAVRRSGIFSYPRLRAWQWLAKLLILDCRFKRLLNSALLLVLTVQILDHLCVRQLKESLRRRI
jgi:asparagine synthase (glutamine-hydrolysing)